jgi:hypothetical protein
LVVGNKNRVAGGCINGPMTKSSRMSNGSNGTEGAASTSTLGDIIVALFDEAAMLTADPRRATRLAISALRRILIAARAQRAAHLLTSEM